MEMEIDVKKATKIVLGAAAGVAVVIIAVSASQSGSSNLGPGKFLNDKAPAASSTTVAPTGHTITYSLTGGTAGLIDYVNPGSMDQTQITEHTALPWSKTFTVTDASQLVFLSVEAQNAGSGTMTCSISEDGKVVDTNSSSGAYALVNCAKS